MNSQTTLQHPPQRKISPKQQQSVNEILDFVADQTRKISLSEADYRAQKRIQRKKSQNGEYEDEEYIDDSSSTSSVRSYSPPLAQESSSSSLFWDTSLNLEHKKHLSTGDLLGKNPRGLPPLEPIKATKKPTRPPSRLGTTREPFENDEHVELKKPARPMSARGQRTLPRARGLTT
ncbi:uncharacterized protein LOC116296966 [Actinia tenebrosa]|uniref:Uncharacterized protein LOC116296966 n=1 Tax=Actinia tenebrosa TaxID=6105 RepID=A0A6P8I7C2_ACTTE|nr:uncharacterized protein LOC116296966 [Actinia tenebrosa]XP_031560953.1 uncharacterized protein LOC116296966 [Actinia tenebrosa]XP_031560954.1 uncharacterized protein LOC116296966 [Actinia tenebrosa]XP_031560955.1 uncharacterized protein LOC116296966 [Actinia tenebrosa]XP_031560956.1 uncharacterized protein LOC116296966 [Actinia tenebrosa]XP_031560957.1 uncharacterized protein LOC116296966 [Actinia tenebrosa]XP_031560958.1 uncharacterized protein LOC116296966 [Actinia tenebrosa]